MENMSVLLVVNLETPTAYIAECAQLAMQRGTRLTCLLFGRSVTHTSAVHTVSPYGGIVLSDEWARLVREARDEMIAREDELKLTFRDSGVSGDVTSVLCAPSEAANYVASLARVADLASIAPNVRDDAGLFDQICYGVLFSSSTGLMLNAFPSQAIEHAFIAWDGSQAASAAVHAALSHLKDGGKITVGCFDPVIPSEEYGMNPGSDVAGWLSHHGLDVTVNQYPSGGLEIGTCIQDRAKEAGAGLVVLGAYGRSRMMQTLFGGTTKSMMGQTKLPMLLSH